MGAVLGVSIVITGDGARADIGSGPDRGIAQVGEVAGLDADAEGGGLDLDEVADMDIAFQHRARPQAGEGADDAVRPDHAALQVAEGADRRPARHAHAVAEDDAGLDRHIWFEMGVGAEEDGGRVDHRHPRVHRRRAQPSLHHRLGAREFGAGVDARQFLRRRLHGGDARALGAGQRDHVGEIVFAPGVIVPHRPQPARHVGGVRAQHPGVAQIDRALGLRRVRPFDDPRHHLTLDIPWSAASGQHPSIAARVGGPERQQGEARISRAPPAEQAAHRLLPDQRVVGVEHRDLAGAKMLHGLEGGVRGAEAVVLDDMGMRRRLPRHRVHVRAEHDDDAVERGLATGDQVAQHGAARDLVQGLGEGGLHARAETGGEKDGGCVHTGCLLRCGVPVSG